MASLVNSISALSLPLNYNNGAKTTPTQYGTLNNLTTYYMYIAWGKLIVSGVRILM